VIYAEYIERNRAPPSSFARVERIAPEPSVICLWQNSGMARMDGWEAASYTKATLRDPAARALRLSVSFTSRGLYDEVVGSSALRKGRHFIEFFPVDEEATNEQIRDKFIARARPYPEGRFCFVLRCVDLLGPDPGSLAIWTFANYAAVEPIACERRSRTQLRPFAAGLYRNFKDARA
jgi:hypothetical protein